MLKVEIKMIKIPKIQKLLAHNNFLRLMETQEIWETKEILQQSEDLGIGCGFNWLLLIFTLAP